MEYEKHKKHYGCNFAIGTGRHDVLTPISDGRFWADSDFTRYSDLFPTEHTFFTLYALVKTSKGCFDIFSKNPVTEDQLKDLKRIDCEGFVKIVLFYVLGNDGAAQISECYIDGLVVPIVESEMA